MPQRSLIGGTPFTPHIRKGYLDDFCFGFNTSAELFFNFFLLFRSFRPAIFISYLVWIRQWQLTLSPARQLYIGTFFAAVSETILKGGISILQVSRCWMRVVCDNAEQRDFLMAPFAIMLRVLTWFTDII